MSKKVVLVDCDPVFREALQFILERKKDLEIVAVGKSIKDMIHLTDLHSPEFLFFDMEMDKFRETEMLRLLIERQPGMKAILYTNRINETSVLRAAEIGLSGYLLKEMRVDELVGSINHLIKGNDYIHHKAISIIIEAYRLLVKGHKNPLEIYPPPESITCREYEVLQLLANGKSNREIGESIGIHTTTVKNHLSNILIKLQVKDRTNAVILAIKNKWVKI